MTVPAARALAEFAVGLRYEVIPNAVIDRAKTCIIDTVGAMTFGTTQPWSRIMIEYVNRTSLPGKGSIVGTEYKVRGQMASLANGVLAHAFELDSLCHPSVGVHPGASLTAPGIPVAQAQGRSGKELLTAFVAGFEVMKDGRALEIEAHDFEGMPARPLTPEQLRAKFLKLTADTKAMKPEAVLARLEALEEQGSVTGILD